MRRLTLLAATAAGALSACSGEVVDEQPDASPVGVDADEVACAIYNGDDPGIGIWLVLSGGEATVFASGGTAETVSVGEVVGVRVERANDEGHGDFGFGDIDEAGVTFSGDTTLDREMPGYSMTWRRS